MQNFDDLDIEGRTPSHLPEADKEKEDYDRKRLMRSSVTAEDGTLRPVYSETEDGDIWCHICNIALFGAHKLMNHNMCNRHKMKLNEWPYPVLLWSKRSDIAKAVAPVQSTAISDGLAPGEPVPPGMEDQITRTTTIQMSLDRHRSSPLVGLEYLLELVDNDSCEPSYTCVLCDKRGDPRTVMAHITSYNHRITYLNRHFPTISRAIMELPRTPNYKRGANEISVLVAKKIEERFGRLQPQLVDKNQFEKNRIQYIKRVYQDYHFRETPELTFMDVYDVRWVTNFDEKMAEMNDSSSKKDLPPIDEKLVDDKRNKSDDKKSDKPPKKETKLETTKSGFKIRILTRDKLSIRKPLECKDEDIPPIKKSPKRPSDETKSLSSLSSISSSPSPSRSRSRSPMRSRNAITLGKPNRYRSKSRYSRERTHSRTRSQSRSRSRTPEPLRERDKWDKYREQIRRAEETLDRSLKFHEKNPEKHPSYPDEWKKFWNRRYKELQAEGKDPSKHDFKPEWIEFWNKRMREIHNEQLQQRKEEIRKRLELPEDKPPEKWIRRDRSPPKRRHRVESDDEVEYVGTKTIKTDYYDRHEVRERDYGYPYVRGRGNMNYRTNYYPRGLPPRTRQIHYATPYPVKDKSPSPVPEEVLTENLEVVGLLRLLTALEGQLGSLGPKIVSLLSKALAAEKARPNSAEELLYDEEVSVLFETVKEKLKGQLFAGMIEKMAINPTKSAIQNIAQLLHKTAESKRKKEEEEKKKKELEAAKSVSYVPRPLYSRPIEVAAPVIKSEPVSVPGVGTVDKVAIAQQIAAALIAQGRTNVSQEELETLINAVVGMAEASKNSDKPVTTADFVKGLSSGGGSSLPQATPAPIVPTTADVIERPTSRMESLSDTDLKSLLQNFKDLSSQEQHGLINFLKKLEATDPVRVEKLRAFVNLGTSTALSSKVKLEESEKGEGVSSKTRSMSPFSGRKEHDKWKKDEDKWKPKIDMFANDDEEEEQQTKNDNDDKQKTKLDLSDDDDDYSFEDIYKAADKNVSENEKKKKSRFSKSASNSPRSWTRSRSRSVSPVRSKETKSQDPNAILNETKRLIANIMGDLPNKYVPKSHLPVENQPEQTVSNDSMSNSSTAAVPGFCNQDYSQNSQHYPPARPQGSLTYPNMNPQNFNYNQQVYGSNSGYVDNTYNYQGYGNMGSQYGGPSMTNQYQNYDANNYGGHSSNYQPQQQQYGNYMPQQQQQRFY
ncbi:uncharacterized protein CG7065-like [Ceratina calcarata]|uniref:Uncharacterized protein CG7065-like n=1 Tax=Ceratina calcarata TaxID=156304 RepID=A0AAJ7JAA4_9HYME|nr:uncharacterized protein CG7065-like [Ceratina calcarata]